MPLKLDGTYGVSGVDGSNTTPSVRGGTSASNGVFYGTNTVSIATNATTAVTVDSSQNVGIGTSSPTNKLQITGNASYANVFLNANYSSSENNNNIGLKIQKSGYGSSGAWPMYGISPDYGNGNLNILFENVGNTYQFTSSATRLLSITDSGNLLVGATNSVARFYAVSGANNVPAGRFDIGVSGDVAQAAVYVVKFDNNSTTSQVFHKFFINGGASGCGQINANGAGAAAFGSTSDARLKENIEAIPNQLSNILALKPSEFDFKDGSGHQIGFIAQEMQQVYPDAINENDEGFLTITGWGRTEARLVSAIQELSAKLDAAEARIAALEAK